MCRQSSQDKSLLWSAKQSCSIYQRRLRCDVEPLRTRLIISSSSESSKSNLRSLERPMETTLKTTVLGNYHNYYKASRDYIIEREQVDILFNKQSLKSIKAKDPW